MEMCENTKRNVFSVLRNTRNTFFRIFVFFSVSRNDRNSAKQGTFSNSFVLRETKKKIRNCQPLLHAAEPFPSVPAVPAIYLENTMKDSSRIVF